MATGNIYSKFCEVWFLTHKQTNPQTCKHMYIIQHKIEHVKKQLQYKNICQSQQRYRSCGVGSVNAI